MARRRRVLAIVAAGLVALGTTVFLLSTYWITAPPLEIALQAAPPASALRFGIDTFAFANENRTIYQGKPDLYPNWCFVMAHAVSQFQRFARFDPAAPRLTPEEYTARVRQITARAAWREALSPADRIVIPGYAALNDFSRGEERSVKAGLGDLTARFLSWIHWTNWRVVYPMPPAHQEGVARETLAELHAGRAVQWLITNLPTIELNHTVVVYTYRDQGPHIDFLVYDPNDPGVPGTIRFDRQARRFASTRVYNTTVGPIRAFRMYYSPLL